MIGAIVMVVVLLLIPVGVFLAGGVLAAVLGHFFTTDIERDHEGTEYVALS